MGNNQQTTAQPASGSEQIAESQAQLFGAPEAIGAAGEVFVDPRLCRPWEGNPRAAANLDPQRNAALVESIREDGQQVAAIVRPAKNAGEYEIIAGCRRHAAVSALLADQPGLLFRVEVRVLDDSAAWLVSEVENRGRRDITALQRARTWRWAVDNLHGGRQDKLAEALGVDRSVVSRTLQLLDLPSEVLGALVDPEAVTVHFGEQLAEALKNESKRAEVIAAARSLTDGGQTLRGPELIQRLLFDPKRAESFRPVAIAAGSVPRQAVWTSKPNGAATLTIRPGDTLSSKERKALMEAIKLQISGHLGLS